MAEAQSPSSASSSNPAEVPSKSAELRISMRPVHISASRAAPATEAHALATTFATVLTVFAGIGGAVLTLAIVSGRPV